MANCPCCNKSLSSSGSPGELCPECMRALETGIDDAPDDYSPPESVITTENPPDAVDAAPRPVVERPLGISLLAIHGFFITGVTFMLALALVAGNRAINLFLALLIPSAGKVDASPLTFGVRLAWALLILLLAWIGYLIWSGVWRLRNWARLIVLFGMMLDVLGGGSTSFFPLFEFLPQGPASALLATILSFLLVLYLFSVRVKTAFGVTNLTRRWLYTFTAIAVATFGFSIYKSDVELKALRWHLRHGNTISVNGVTFPVYAWYAPVEGRSGQGFHIEDMPGPFRENDQLTFITVEGCKKEEDENLTTAQRADKELASYKKSGYTNLRRFQLKVRDQALECMEDVSYSHTMYCYGDGPIAQVFFAGGDTSWARFSRMIAEAR